MSAAEAAGRVLRPVPELPPVPPEGPHRLDKHEFYPGRATYEGLLDSTQAVSFSPMEMSPVITPIHIRQGDEVVIKPRQDRGVVVHCSLIVETGTSTTFAASNNMSGDTFRESLSEDVESEAVKILPPIAIANGKELLEPRLVGMIRNKDISQHPVGEQPLTLDGEAITRTLALLLTTSNRPEVTFGDPKFFREPTEAYGYNLIGPEDPGTVRLVGLAYNAERPTTQVVPLDNAEIRQGISEGRIKLGALAMLNGKGDLTILGADTWREEAGESPYPCMLLYSGAELAPVPVEQELSDNLRMLMTAQAPTEEVPVPPTPAYTAEADAPVTEPLPAATAEAGDPAEERASFFKAPANFGQPVTEGPGQPTLGFRDDEPFGFVANPGASRSRMFGRRGKGLPSL